MGCQRGCQLFQTVKSEEMQICMAGCKLKFALVSAADAELMEFSVSDQFKTAAHDAGVTHGHAEVRLPQIGMSIKLTQPVNGKFRHITRRPAILILPGGAYAYCSDREADPVAFPYLQAGFQTFILRYSVGTDAVWPNPLEDVEQAMELIRTREDWNVAEDRVAVIGFSAGGHLAAAAATMARNRPNAAIIGYGVVGHNVVGCNPTAPDTVKAVDGKTCPCFLFASRTDTVVPIQNSLDFMTALAAANVSIESHIYAFGPHGFSTCDSAVRDPNRPFCDRTPHWVGDSIGWLRDMFGDFSDGDFAPPRCGSHFTDDNEPHLSVDCTLGHLMGNETALRILEPLFRKAREMGFTAMDQIQHVPCRTLLEIAGLPAEKIEQINRMLRQIPNE